MLDTPVPSIPQRPKTRPTKSSSEEAPNIAVSHESSNSPLVLESSSSSPVPAIPQRPKRSESAKSHDFEKAESSENLPSDPKSEVPAVPAIPSRPKHRVSETPEAQEPLVPLVPRRPKREQSEEKALEEVSKEAVQNAENKQESPIEPEASVSKDAADQEPIEQENVSKAAESHSNEQVSLLLILQEELSSEKSEEPIVSSKPEEDIPKQVEEDEEEAGEKDRAEELRAEVKKSNELDTHVGDAKPAEEVDPKTEIPTEATDLETAHKFNEGSTAFDDPDPLEDIAQLLGNKIKEQRRASGVSIPDEDRNTIILPVETAMADEVEEIDPKSFISKSDSPSELEKEDEPEAQEPTEEAHKEFESSEPPATESKEVSVSEKEIPDKGDEGKEPEPTETEPPAEVAVKDEPTTENPAVESSKEELVKTATEDAREPEEPAPKMPIIPKRPGKPSSLNSDALGLEAKSSPSIPARPPKPANKEGPKAPPPKPKKLSSKIAAFQQMFNQEPEAPAKESPKPVPRGKLSSDKTNFAANLLNIMGPGIALPGMANPELLKKLSPAEPEAADDEPKSEGASKGVTRRAKGPRGKKLPKSITDTKLTIESPFKFSHGTLWELDFKASEPKEIEPERAEIGKVADEDLNDKEVPSDATSETIPLDAGQILPERDAPTKTNQEKVSRELDEAIPTSTEAPIQEPQETSEQASTEEVETPNEPPTKKAVSSNEQSDIEPDYEIISKEKAPQVLASKTTVSSPSEDLEDENEFQEAREAFSSPAQPQSLGDLVEAFDDIEDSTARAEKELEELSGLVSKDHAVDEEPVVIDKETE